MNLIYLIGYPGAGKTTALATALDILHYTPTQHTQPVPHITYTSDTHPQPLTEIGKRRDTFSGTDALGMGAQPRILDWITTRPAPTLIAEGDRLGNLSFLATAANTYTVTVIHIDTPPDTAITRATLRASLNATQPQNPTWVKGRHTKVNNITRNWRGPLIHIDGTATPLGVASTIADIIIDTTSSL